MSSKRWIALVIAIALFFVSIVYQFGVSFSQEETGLVDTKGNLFGEKVIKPGSPIGGGKIAVLNLEGVILDTGEIPFGLAYDHKGFLSLLDRAANDPLVDGIIIRVNSPGGGVVESAEIHDKIVHVKEETGKPVYISMGNTAASGGYYISAPADKIFAHAATLTGSIGVIMENINFSEFADELGIDFNTIKSGEFKDIMSSTRPMTEEEAAILQTIIDDLYDDFVKVIVDGRGMDEAKVREIGDGRIYTGRQAYELNLIDEIGSFDDAITAMEEDLGLGDAQVVEYRPGFGFSQLFGFAAKSFVKNDANWLGLLNAIRDSSGPRAMYLYSN